MGSISSARRSLLRPVPALHDTIAWDAIYARATGRAYRTGFAQLNLERGPADYDLVDGSDSTALKIDRLTGAKIHVIRDWPRLRPRNRQLLAQ